MVSGPGKFTFGLIVISVSIIVSLVSFMKSENSMTGYAVLAKSGYESIYYSQPLKEYITFESLGMLAKGDYYVASDGIVYWLEDDSKPAIGRVLYITSENRGRTIHIDNDGRIGYLIS